ncbi:MAG: hypothetical protein K8F32_08615 [Rhodocyclaceae bacterium]|nr:hypothetical protein [Rhodocyclaceae bacterium]
MTHPPGAHAPVPAASATAIFQQGNQADEARRLSFCNRLIRFADLDAYPRRAQFIAAYSTGGTEAARRIEARFLADSGLLRALDVAWCAERAGVPVTNPEIR